MSDPTMLRCAWCDEEIASATEACEHCGLEQGLDERPEPLDPRAANPGTCPWCAEDIKPDAVVCKHCGRGIAGGGDGSGSGTNGFAIASLVLGIVSLAGIGSVLAIVFGFVARSQIAESGRRQGGSGMAVAGIVLGFVGLVAVAIWVVLLVAANNAVDSYSY